jgi:hypothetical protein
MSSKHGKMVQQQEIAIAARKIVKTTFATGGNR